MIVLRRFGRTLFAAALGLGLGLSPFSPASAAVTPLGEPFPVDAAPDCQEHEPDVAALPGGGFVTVWTAEAHRDFLGAERVYVRAFDGNHNPVAAEFPVAPLSQSQSRPAVAARPDGRFLVVWRDDSFEILGRLFNPDGTARGGTFQIGNLYNPGEYFESEHGEEADVTALPDGGFAVVWTDEGGTLFRRFDGDGQPSDPSPFLLAFYDGGIIGISALTTSPSIAVQPSGDLLVVYTVQGIRLTSVLSSSIVAQRFPAGTPDPTESPVISLHSYNADANRAIWGSDIGVDASGSFVVAWREEEQEIGRHDLFARRFNAAGTPLGDVLPVDNRSWGDLRDPEVLMDPAGSFLVGWSAVLHIDSVTPPFPPQSTVWARTFDAQGTPNAIGASRRISPDDETPHEHPALAWTGPGEAVAVWQDGTESTPILAPACFSAGITARAFSTGCLPGENRLCLGEGRFQLEATWTAPAAGGSGPGRAVGVTRDTGYFWFFNPENVELMVKVLDGRTINGKFWVFYGSLSNVAWTLTVTDLVTGATKTYQNPAGQLASRGDTAALPGASSASIAGGVDNVVVQAFDTLGLDRDALPAPGEAGAPAALAAPLPSHTPGENLGGPCNQLIPTLPLPSRPGLCLNDQRFEVEVTWHDPFNGGQGTGQGVPLTDDSGYFWFFDPANVELVVKVLDARTVNGKYWVFYGALTNVEYDIRVRHLLSGTEKTYHNPPFQFRSVADTAAFPGTLP